MCTMNTIDFYKSEYVKEEDKTINNFVTRLKASSRN